MAETWERNALRAPVLTNMVTIDPAANQGQRAEVAIKGLSNGTFMMTRGLPGGWVMLDIGIRYSLGQGDSGVYLYSTRSYPASYPAWISPIFRASLLQTGLRPPPLRSGGETPPLAPCYPRLRQVAFGM